MNTLDVLKEIYDKIPEIDKFLFHYFPKQKLLQERIEFENIENIQFKEALSIRDKYNLPFWDSIMLTYFGKKVVSSRILECALLHNEIKNEYFTSDINWITEVLQKENEVPNIAFNSKVKLKAGIYKHLPLIDFHIPTSSENLDTVIKVIKLLGFSKGYIMESGESYHFIGTELMDNDQLLTMLSRALLFSPIIDRAWIAHQLLERSSSLRIGFKHRILPQLIDTI